MEDAITFSALNPPFLLIVISLLCPFFLKFLLLFTHQVSMRAFPDHTMLSDLSSPSVPFCGTLDLRSIKIRDTLLWRIQMERCEIPQQVPIFSVSVQ